jgi:hypothetical protein
MSLLLILALPVGLALGRALTSTARWVKACNRARDTEREIAAWDEYITTLRDAEPVA